LFAHHVQQRVLEIASTRQRGQACGLVDHQQIVVVKDHAHIEWGWGLDPRRFVPRHPLARAQQHRTIAHHIAVDAHFTVDNAGKPLLFAAVLVVRAQVLQQRARPASVDHVDVDVALVCRRHARNGDGDTTSPRACRSRASGCFV
jgi:hypothetical protein